MYDIQKAKRIYRLCGLHKDGTIKAVPDIMCVRKHMEPHHNEWKKFRSIPAQDLFAFVSSPQMPDQQENLMAKIKSWCHPFRKREDFLKNNKCAYDLLPESDFMDAAFVDANLDITPKYDFFYMTVNESAGIKHKGLLEFTESLPTICGKMNLTGVMVVYFPSNPMSYRKTLTHLPKKNQKLLDKYSKNIKILWGWQKQPKMAQLMASCKLGFFPNTVDCSPRIIPETLLRNKPIIVNNNIWGGWHYVNSNTGCFFEPRNEKSIELAFDSVLSKKFEPRDYFMSNYGFKKSSARLAAFLKKNHRQLNDFTHVYFNAYLKIMESLL